MYDKKNLTGLKKMEALAPEIMKAFWAFDKAAVAAGAIPVKYKELIAVAVACTTQCPYCIDIHAANARKAGASVRLYMDVHVPAPITRALIGRGVDVKTAQEDGTTELKDDKLLERATELKRVLFSRDEDLLAEATERQRKGEFFARPIL